MDPITIGAGITAGASLVGGILGASETRSANSKNTDLQREFARNGLRWRMEDAKAAGLSPLAALGANTPSAPQVVGDTSMPNALQNMGQDVGRAVQQTRTAEERTLANLALQSAQLDLTGKTIDNQIKASQLRKLNQVGPAMGSHGNGMVVPGQGDTSYLSPKPAQPVYGDPNNPAKEPGSITSVGYMKNDDGSLSIVPSDDAKQRTEDDLIQQVAWSVRNQLVPALSGPNKKPDPRDYDPGAHKEWRWSRLHQAWIPDVKLAPGPSSRKRTRFNPNPFGGD